MIRNSASIVIGLIVLSVGCGRHRDTTELPVAERESIEVVFVNEDEFRARISDDPLDARLQIEVVTPEGAKPASIVMVEATKRGIIHGQVSADMVRDEPESRQLFEIALAKEILELNGKYEIKATATFHHFDVESGTIETTSVESDTIDLEVEK
jgi:hypothetical protein